MVQWLVSAGAPRRADLEQGGILSQRAGVRQAAAFNSRTRAFTYALLVVTAGKSLKCF